jgi:predicted transposase YdaD
MIRDLARKGGDEVVCAPTASVSPSSLGSMAHQPHDSLVKAALSRQENAVGALRAVLPPALLAQLDLSTLRLSQDSFVDEHLGKLFSDLVYEVDVAGRPGLICFVLYEHQSTVDALQSVRLLAYMTRVWDAWLQENPRASKIPPVIPVVLYHGPQPWTASTSLPDVIDLPEAALAAAREHLPLFRFLLDDLTVTADADLRTRESAVLGRLTFLLLKHARSLVAGQAGPGSLAGFLRSVSDLLGALGSRDDRIRVFSYIIEVVEGADPSTLVDALGGAAASEVREDAMTAGEKLRQEGRQEGRLEGQRRTLLRLLRAKFGPLSAEAEARVAAADEAMLDTWADRVLTAARLADVWA